MIKNYLKITFRNLFKQKIYTAINLVGLGVASAFCILVYWYVKQEKSFDQFHQNGKQLYRLESSDVFNFGKDTAKKSFFSSLMADAEQKNMLISPVMLASDLQKAFPEIATTVRIQTAHNPVIRINNQSFKEKDDNVAYVDHNFFTVFNFPLIKGTAKDVLNQQNNVVLSQKASVKYFGHANPIGKTIAFPNDNNTLYTVSGIAKDFPANSSFQFDLMIPREGDPNYQNSVSNGKNSYSDLVIIQLKKGINVNAFQKKLDDFGKAYYGAGLKEMAANGGGVTPESFHLTIRPFADAHYNKSEGWGHYTDLKNIYQLCCLAVVILLIACLNYVLLTLTSAVARSQEVGIRKTIGADRKQIVFLFWIETQALAILAVVTGFVLAAICLPLFSSLIGTDLQLKYFSLPEMVLLLLALAFVLGLLAGIYPALILSGLKPLNMLRSFSTYKLNPTLSKVLVVVQFTVCIVLVISALAINKQMRFLNETDLGFDKDQVVVLQSPFGWDQKQQAFELKERLSNFVTTEPAIQNFTTTAFPYQGYNRNGHLINGERIMLQEFSIDYNYLPFCKIPIVKGRNFSPLIASDSARFKIPESQQIKLNSNVGQAVIVNETLYKMLGQPALNEINREMGAIIVGVCKDYHADDLTKKIEPAYHRISTNYIGFYWFKIKPGQSIPKTMDKIRANWSQLTGNALFSYTFLDETVAKKYEAYQRWMQVITVSSLLAILVACLGLFGLSGITAVNRTKEIGIRKVLGASLSNLFVLLNRSTLLLAAAAFVVAVPISLYLIKQWLENFAYRTEISWTIFALAGSISVFAAIVAVSFHTIKAALANPVKSLRSE